MEEPWLLSAKSLPSNSRLMATVANGYLGTRVYGDILHVNGVYNGSVGDCHRANVPSPLNVQLVISKEDILDETYSLNIRTGNVCSSFSCTVIKILFYLWLVGNITNLAYLCEHLCVS